MTKRSAASGNNSPAGVAPRIAWRYLISKKSHSAVSAIAGVSVCGMAVATAAIICVLSVFNGFRRTIADRVDLIISDILVEPIKGKVFENADSVAMLVAATEGVKKVTPVLADNALALCDAREMPVMLKGVADFSEKEGDAHISIGAAAGLSATEGSNILLFAPKRIGRVNLANPAASFITDSVTASTVFRTDRNETDENTIITDIEIVRELLQYDSEASSLEITLSPGSDPQAVVKNLETALGPGFSVKDRLHQQEMNFRMISIEKWITFLLLFFILIIASFNIISSLSMLVLDKEKSIGTLRALGFSRKDIGRIFFWESVFVTLLGSVAGIILGVALTLLQQTTGIIHLQGDPQSLIVVAYPVELQGGDILLTMIPLVIIGLAAAMITSSFARSRI